ncbi:MAG: hypothetical protein LIO70_06885 [Clostridiales bacterium]|nr:hypothetical protein [Clostridiales bacterium]
MKTKELIHWLNDTAQDQREFCETLPEGDIRQEAAHRAAALEEAVRRIETPTDRCLANEILILAGLILGMVAVISVLCGVIYILMGNYTAAWAMLPWAITAAVAALLAFAGVRK